MILLKTLVAGSPAAQREEGSLRQLAKEKPYGYRGAPCSTQPTLLQVKSAAGSSKNGERSFARLRPAEQATALRRLGI
jgi:hypothetical protein